MSLPMSLKFEAAPFDCQPTWLCELTRKDIHFIAVVDKQCVIITQVDS